MSTPIFNSENPFLGPQVSNNPFLSRSASKNPFLRRNPFHESDVRSNLPNVASPTSISISTFAGLFSAPPQSASESPQHAGALTDTSLSQPATAALTPSSPSVLIQNRDRLDTNTFLDSLQEEDLRVGRQASLQAAYPPLSPLPNARPSSLAFALPRGVGGYPQGSTITIPAQRPADDVLDRGPQATLTLPPRPSEFQLDAVSPPPYTPHPDYEHGEVTMEVEPHISLPDATAPQISHQSPVNSVSPSIEPLASRAQDTPRQTRRNLRLEISSLSPAGPSSPRTADFSRMREGRRFLQEAPSINSDAVGIHPARQPPVSIADDLRRLRRSNCSTCDHNGYETTNAFGQCRECSQHTELDAIGASTSYVARNVQSRYHQSDYEMALALHISLESEISPDTHLSHQPRYNFGVEGSTRKQSSLHSRRRKTFDCRICLETLSEDALAGLEGCKHQFCRGCLSQYIMASLEDVKFPIACPVCMVSLPKVRSRVRETTSGPRINRKEPENGGVVSHDTFQMLGIPNKYYHRWVKLELGEHSVLLDCRRCRQSVLVDKHDLMAATIVFCQMGCGNIWCRKCSKSVNSPLDSDHSCDGSVELEAMIQREGWKRCPTCKIPVERLDGCNHMACRVPGCNTHFCYVDGTFICQTVNGIVAKKTVERHYQHSCTLFEVPEEAEIEVAPRRGR